MKLQQRQNKKSKIILVVTGVTVLVLAATYTAVAYYQHLWPFLKTETQQSKEKDVKDNSKPSAKTDAPTSNSNENVDPTKTTNEIPKNDTLSLTITNLSQQNGSVTYTATLGDASQNGSCVAEFTSEGTKPVTSTVDAKNGTCGPVSIPENEFSKLGAWTLTLRYYINNTQAVATKTIDIH